MPTARMASAVSAPRSPISPCATGTSAACPSEPPALASPIISPRRCGGTARPTAASAAPVPVQETPSPVRMPMPRSIVAALGSSAGSASPAASSTPPTAMTRPAP